MLHKCMNINYFVYEYLKSIHIINKRLYFIQNTNSNYCTRLTTASSSASLYSLKPAGVTDATSTF